jgi:hypothetical protein
MSDLKNAFNWNSKVLFLYIVAEYASKTAVRSAADPIIDSSFSNIYFFALFAAFESSCGLGQNSVPGPGIA